jgi:hypothetical protein
VFSFHGIKFGFSSVLNGEEFVEEGIGRPLLRQSYIAFLQQHVTLSETVHQAHVKEKKVLKSLSRHEKLSASTNSTLQKDMKSTFEF